MNVGTRNLRVLIIGSCFACSGCMTMSITHTSTESLQIVTKPDNASVSLSTGETCTSPCKLSINRRDDIELTVVAPGCKTELVPLELQRDEFSVTRGILLGIVGAAIAYALPDVLPTVIPWSTSEANAISLLILGGMAGITSWRSGTAYSHKPNPVYVELRCVGNDAISR